MSRAREMIEKENNPEVLKVWALWMQEHSKKIEQDNERLRKIIAEREAAKQQTLDFEVKLSRLRDMLFKSGREKRKYSVDRPRLDDDKELLLYAQSLLPPLENE